MIRGFKTLAAFAALLGAVGCGSDRYPVSGKVTLEDGSPLTEGNVVGEMGTGADRVMVQGDVRPDGSFEWGTLRPGDGAKPGRYKVIVLPRALGDSELAQGMQPDVDDKYSRYETSGIEFEVKPQKNELNITVTKPKPKKK